MPGLLFGITGLLRELVNDAGPLQVYLGINVLDETVVKDKLAPAQITGEVLSVIAG